MSVFYISCFIMFLCFDVYRMQCYFITCAVRFLYLFKFFISFYDGKLYRTQRCRIGEVLHDGKL